MGKDAEVIIKISGDAKDFDSKYAQLVKEYKNKEIDIGITANDLELANSKLNEMNRVNEDIEGRLREINNQINAYEGAIASLNEKNATLNRSIWEEKRLYLANEDTIKSLNAKIEAQNRLATEVTQEQNKQLDAILQQYNVIDKIEGKYEKQKNDLNVIGTKLKEASNVDLGSKIEQTGKSVSKTVKNVSKWGLAILGVRSIYMGIRSVMNNVLSQNEGLSKQMNGLKNSLYAAFTPIVEKIINLIRTLMAYINYIWQAFFKKDLFKNVVKSTESTSKNLKSGAASAKEINKQLAGFDEANVLSNNKSSSGGGVGSTDSGDINLGLDKIKMPKWLQDIRDFIEKHPTIAKIIFGLAAFTLFGGWKLAAGITTAIGSLLGISGTGALATGAAGLLGLLHTLTLLVAAVWLIKLDYDAVKELNESLDDLIDSYVRAKRWLEVTTGEQDKYNDTMAKTTGLTEKQEEVTKGHIETLIDEILYQKGSTEGLKLSEKQLRQTIKAYSEKYRTGQMTEEQEKSYAKFIKDNLVSAFAAGSKGAEAMEEDLKALDTKYGTSYTLDIQEHGLDEFGKKLKNTGTKIDTFLKKWQQVGDKILASFGITSAAQYKAMFHASGGIVNLPGRGVPVTHYAGEAGREGIIPMDNESQMQLLGQAIAKYVNINNVVNNYMDARKINSILQASANNERLANNG